MSAERAVLGGLLRSNAIWRDVAKVVSGDDFMDARLGAVFDGICGLLATGGRIEPIEVEAYFPEWGVRGIGAQEPWQWIDLVTSPGAAVMAAQAVRASGVRRRASEVLERALAELADPSSDPEAVAERVGRELITPSRDELRSVTLQEVLLIPDVFDWVVPGLLERMDRLILTGHEGHGKALALDTPILTPRGWSTMGDLRVGDEVYGPDGKTATVTFATEVQYDRECYSVEFSGGARIVADADHLWRTFDYHERMSAARQRGRTETAPRGTDQRDKARLPQIRTTAEIADTLLARNGHTLNHSIPTCEPLVGTARELAVPPYVLGAWLGDGSTNDGHITAGDEDAWWIEKRFADEGWATHRTKAPLRLSVRGLRVALREVGVLGNKHIPVEYLTASLAQRLDLLQGLMDTDGWVGRVVRGGVSCEFSVCNERLARDVCDLLHTLGVKVVLRRGMARLNGREVGERWRLTFATDLPVVSLPRKAERIRPLRTERARTRYIRSVTRVESVPVRCIQVDNESRMYLAGRELIPTHNTTFARQFLVTAGAGLHPFTLERIEPVRSLVVDAENTARQWTRATRSMANLALRQSKIDPSPNVHLALSGRLDLVRPTTLGSIHRLIDAHKPGIVFLGPLYRLAIQMNNEEQMAPVIAALDTIRDRGVALIVEAHAGHVTDATGNRDVRPRGSSALLGWPEFGLGLRRNGDPSDPDLYDLIAWRGGREHRDWPAKVRRGVRELGDWPWVAEK